MTLVAIVEPKTPPVVEFREVNPFDLRALQAIVGGWIEAVRVSRTVSVYVNEEGKLVGLGQNPVAQVLGEVLGMRLWPDDYLVGPVVFFGGYDEEGEDRGLLPEDVRQIATFCALADVGICADIPGKVFIESFSVTGSVVEALVASCEAGQ